MRYVSRVKSSNPRKGVEPSSAPLCSSYWKGSIQVPLDNGRRHYSFGIQHRCLFQHLYWCSKLVKKVISNRFWNWLITLWGQHSRWTSFSLINQNINNDNNEILIIYQSQWEYQYNHRLLLQQEPHGFTGRLFSNENIL